MRVLIAYYSKTGNTESIANAIRATLEPNHEVVMQKIEMQKEYSNFMPHLNPRILFDILLNRKPRIKPTLSISSFDLVCVGTPDWFGKVHPSINTFIESITPVNGMKAIAFVSSGWGRQSYADSLKEKLEKKGFKVLRKLSFILRETSEAQIREVREAVT